MTVRDALVLGRVSNLPTVWTNVLAGAALSGAVLTVGPLVALSVAMSLFYVGGMYLNDAFDSAWDAAHRPDRPIPAGRADVRMVFIAGFTMLAAGVAIVTAISSSLPAILAAAGLGALIVLYNRHHKGNPISPLLMGLCRVMVYVTTAYTLTSAPSAALWVGCVALLSYLIGLTFTAKQETLKALPNLWPLVFLVAPVIVGLGALGQGMAVVAALVLLVASIGRALWFLLGVQPPAVGAAVIRFIAGIALVDALLISIHGEPLVAALAVAACALTRLLQRIVPGT